MKSTSRSDVDSIAVYLLNYTTPCFEALTNGYSKKTLKSRLGEIPIDVPRDRKGEFEPQIIQKHQRDISGLEEKIISLYARGMSTQDIHDQV